MSCAAHPLRGLNLRLVAGVVSTRGISGLEIFLVSPQKWNRGLSCEVNLVCPDAALC